METVLTALFSCAAVLCFFEWCSGTAPLPHPLKWKGLGIRRYLMSEVGGTCWVTQARRKGHTHPSTRFACCWDIREVSCVLVVRSACSCVSHLMDLVVSTKARSALVMTAFCVRKQAICTFVIDRLLRDLVFSVSREHACRIQTVAHNVFSGLKLPGKVCTIYSTARNVGRQGNTRCDLEVSDT